MDRVAIPRPTYHYLVTESRGLCNLCHREIIGEIHHILPVEHGGSNEYENLIPLCSTCHSKVHKSHFANDELVYAKEDWVNRCCDVVTRIVTESSNDFERTRQIVDSFDAVDSVAEFSGFRERMRHLIDRGSLFRNVFRVHSHHLVFDVDASGDCTAEEVQRLSSFNADKQHCWHVQGMTPMKTADVDFSASVRIRGRDMASSVKVIKDHPTYKSFAIEYAHEVPELKPIEISTRYRWSAAWDLTADRYTYDVFGWAETVCYSMMFPADVEVAEVQDSYIDMFGSEWPNVGRVEIEDNRFTWHGNRLPVFTSVVIAYKTNAAI